MTVWAADRVALPTIASPGGLCIEAKINGAGPFKLIVDTGMGILLLTPQTARAAHLEPTRSSISIDTSATIVTCALTVADRVESGGWAIRRFAAAITNESDLIPFRELGVDGVIGLNQFADSVLEIDFPAQRVYVVRPGTAHYPSDRAVAYRGLVPEVQLDVAGRSIPALIDTGSNCGLILPEMRGYPLIGPIDKDDGIGGFAIGVKQPGRGENARLDGDVHLGPAVWRNPPVRAAVPTQEASIGSDILRARKLAIDQQSHRIYFLEPQLIEGWAKRPVADPRTKLGYHVAYEGAALRLLEVDPEGAFDRAGLRAGDLIVTVDGQGAAQFLRTMSWQEVESRRLRVRRDGNEFTAILDLRRPRSAR